MWHHRTRDPVQQDLVLFSFGGQLCHDEGLMPDRRSQHDNSLLLWGQLCVSSPHHSVGVDGLCCPGQCLAPNWMLSSTVPNLCLAMVDRDATMGLNLLLQDPMHNQHSIWSTCGVHIVKECEKRLSLLQSGVSHHQHSVQTEAKEQRHEGVALLLPPHPVGSLGRHPFRHPRSTLMVVRKTAERMGGRGWQHLSP